MSSRPIRVMHVIETLEIGGAENVLADLVNFCSPRFVPYVCCLKTAGPVAAKLREGTPVFVMNMSHGNDYSLPFRLARLFRHNRIDVVVSHGWGTYLESVLARRFSGARVMVHVVHGDFPPYPSGWLSDVKKLIRHRAEGLFSAGVHQFVAVSQGVKNEIVRRTSIPLDRICVVHNGVRIGNKDPILGAQKRTILGIKSEDVVIGSVGRLAPVKNYPSLLTVFAKVKKEFNNVKLILIGDGDERKSLEQISIHLGLEKDVFFLGQRDDVEDWMQAFDLFALSSLYEGISISILEAMSVYLPVVATDVGGNREVVVDGQTGWIVPPNDPEKMARAMLSLIRDRSLSLEMGHKGFERVKEEFNIEQTIKTYEKIFQVYLQSRIPASNSWCE